MKNQEAKLLTLTPTTLADPNLSPEAWVDRYARLHGIEYFYKTNSVRENGEPLEASLFISAMRLKAHQLGMNNLKRMLPDALLVWRRNQARKFLSGLRQELKFKLSDRDLVAEWVETVTGKRSELDLAVMRHFIWQVRRKIYGLPVDHHMMLVLCGASGGGKSVAVHKLIGPLQDVSTFRDMTIFADQFARRAFHRNYIMFFDELSRSGQIDVNALKNVVTAPVTEWRGIGSEAVHSAPQNCTFIGCSNQPLRERIHDPTSMRRFWQLNCATQLDWEKINTTDYLALWQSVDESAPCPVIPFLSEIRKVQEEELSERDVIKGWLETLCEPAPFSDASPTTYSLYSDFNGWCKWQSISDYPGLQTFARGLQDRIDELKWCASSKRSYCGTVWSLKINSPSPPVEGPKEPNTVLGLADVTVASEAVSASKASDEEA